MQDFRAPPPLVQQRRDTTPFGLPRGPPPPCPRVRPFPKGFWAGLLVRGPGGYGFCSGISVSHFAQHKPTFTKPTFRLHGQRDGGNDVMRPEQMISAGSCSPAARSSNLKVPRRGHALQSACAQSHPDVPRWRCSCCRPVRTFTSTGPSAALLQSTRAQKNHNSFASSDYQGLLSGFLGPCVSRPALSPRPCEPLLLLLPLSRLRPLCYCQLLPLPCAIVAIATTATITTAAALLQSPRSLVLPPHFLCLSQLILPH